MTLRKVLELLSHLNWLALPETVVQSFWHADWDGAYRRGLFGVVAEAVHSLAGTNTWPFFVPLNSGWNGKDIERLLSDHGVEMWGRGFGHGQLFFRVQKRKAAWAQYLLLREGVPLSNRLLTTRATERQTSSTNHRGTGHSPDRAVIRTGENLEQELDNLIDRLASALDL